MLTFTPEQQKANRELWFKELEETNLKQGTGALCYDDKYCCLGVACEVAMKNGLPLEKDKTLGRCFYINNLDESDVSSSFLPKIVRNWLGINTCSGCPKDNDFKACVEMNDNDHKTFKEIAQHLRTNEESYFIC